ncbi:MAG: hypothetical protein WC455_15680 [Dehalococcoidia bacterium]|jgi:hypothetical protein
MELYAGKPLETIELIRQQAIGLGNQQARLAWLAGIFDGEGTVGIYNRPKSNNWFVIVSLCNTHQQSRFMVASILDEINVSGYWQDRKPENPKHNARWSVVISGYGKVSRFLSALMPYLVVKQLQAQIMLIFINSRQNKPMGGRTCNLPNAKQWTKKNDSSLDEFELGCIEALKELKHANSLNESTFHIATQAMKIYSGLCGKRAEVAEMTTRPDDEQG